MSKKFCSACRVSYPPDKGETIYARGSGIITKVWRCNRCISLRKKWTIQIDLGNPIEQKDKKIN